MQPCCKTEQQGAKGAKAFLLCITNISTHSLWWAVTILEARAIYLGWVSPHPEPIYLLHPNPMAGVGWADIQGSLPTQTIPFFSFSVPPQLRPSVGHLVSGFPAVLSLPGTSLDHHWSQEWVRSQTAENYLGCWACKTATVKSQWKNKIFRHLLGEVAAGLGSALGRGEARHPDHCILALAQLSATSSAVLRSDFYSVFGTHKANFRHWKNGDRAENNHGKQLEGWPKCLMVRDLKGLSVWLSKKPKSSYCILLEGLTVCFKSLVKDK